MVDIASIGYQVDTSGLTKGEAALESYERANRSVANSARVAAGATQAFGVTTQNTSRAIQLNALQLQNLQFQLNDIALGLSTGQSPFTVLAQQGLQIAQIFQSGAGLGAAIRAIGTGITSFLLNPINLSVLAIAALAGGVTYLYNTISNDSSVSEVLKEQAKLIEDLADRYDLVSEALKRLQDQSGVSIASTVADTDELIQQQQALEAQIDAVYNRLGQRLQDLASIIPQGTPIELLPADVRQFEQELRQFGRAVQEGTLDVDQLRQRLIELAQAAPRDILAEELRAMSREANDSEEGLRAIVNQLSDVQAALVAVGQTAAALGNIVPGVSNRIDSTFGIFSEAEALERLRGQLTVPENVRSGPGTRIGDAFGLFEGADATESLRRALNRGRDRGRSGRGRLNEYQREIEAIRERTRALEVEAQTFGLSAEAAARYKSEQDLINAAQQAGIALSPEVVSSIQQEADAYARATGALERMQERQSAIQGLSSLLYGAISGASSFADALQRLASSLGDVVLQAALLGQGPIAQLLGLSASGGQTGGILGALFGGLLADGGVLADGRIQAFARGGVVNTPTIFPMANGLGLMGEAGPEAVMPLRRTSDGRLGVESTSTGRGNTTQVNVYNYSNSRAEERRRRDGNGNEVVDIVIGEVRDDMARGGFDNALSGRFGARPVRKRR